MSHKYIVSIGLEIHIVLKTERKVFSPEKINESSWTSLGFPGTLPYLNVEAISKVIKLSSALNCKVNYENILFDRKNYFYYDLPRGYQITQYFHPIGKNGFIEVSPGKKIEIKQIHLEEDSAQQIKSGHEIKISFGRLGRAVAEIVTTPTFSNYAEIEKFIKRLRRICSFLDISDVCFEDGDIRIDLNVSTRKQIADSLSIKSEVKNLNSLSALKQSLEWLSKEQFSKLDKGEILEGYTYCWVEKLKKCEVMRKKGSVSDYFYIPEANIPRLSFSKDQYKQLTYDSRINLDEIEQELMDGGLKDSEVDHLLDNKLLFGYFQKLNNKLGSAKHAYNWLVNIISGLIKDFENFPYVEIEQLIVDTEINKKINLKIAKEVLKEILQNNSTYKLAIKILKVSPIEDEEEIKKMVLEAFEIYKSQIPELLKNLPKFERLIIGECMKKSKGQVDPIKTKEYFELELKAYTSNH